MAKTHEIRFKVEKEDDDAIERKATSMGMDKSSFVRFAVKVVLKAEIITKSPLLH